VFFRDLRLGQLQGGGVSRELHIPVYGDQRHRAAQEDAEGLVVDQSVYLLAQLGELLRVGLYDGAANSSSNSGKAGPARNAPRLWKYSRWMTAGG
jgi:hypothetical protein